MLIEIKDLCPRLNREPKAYLTPHKIYHTPAVMLTDKVKGTAANIRKKEKGKGYKTDQIFSSCA